MIKFEKIPLDVFIEDVSTIDMGIIFPDNPGFLYNALHDLQMPRRATTGSAGYDIRTPFAFTLKPGHAVIVPTGLRCTMPENCVLMIYPRSGMAFKFRMALANGVAIIDSDFYNSNSKGHILLKLCNNGDKPIVFKANDRICQGVFTNYLTTDDDDADGMRDGGVGSTGQA